MLFHEIRIPLLVSPIIWCDNVSALSLASNPISHARTKHIEVDYHYIREKVLNKDITISFISTLDQIADIFTKELSSTRFLFLKSKLKVIPSLLCLRGHVKHTTSSSPIANVPDNSDDPVVHTTTDVLVAVFDDPAALYHYARSQSSVPSSTPPSAKSNNYSSSRVRSIAPYNVIDHCYRVNLP